MIGADQCGRVFHQTEYVFGAFGNFQDQFSLYTHRIKWPHDLGKSGHVFTLSWFYEIEHNISVALRLGAGDLVSSTRDWETTLKGFFQCGVGCSLFACAHSLTVCSMAIFLISRRSSLPVLRTGSSDTSTKSFASGIQRRESPFSFFS